MMKYLALGLVVLLIAACAGEERAPTDSPGTTESTEPPETPFAVGEVVRAEAPRASVSPPDEAVASVVAGDRALGLDLLSELATDDNLMISPYSIATALSMVYAGANGSTEDEMADVLHLEVDAETLHAVRNVVDAALAEATWEPPDEDDTREPFTIQPANSVWGQGGYPFLDDFLEKLATHYGAGMHLADFDRDPDGARDVVNEWAADATEERIEELIPPGVIDRLTRMVLVNAIWFQANWVHQFDPEATADGVFTRPDGTEVTTPMMHKASMRTGYAENDRFAAVHLPYTGDAAMVVLLPKDGSPAELAADLEPGDFDMDWEDRLVELTLPRFEFSSDSSLKDVLEALGMIEAFVPPQGDRGADFTGMTSLRELYVKDALHQSFVAVDEHGTEAAAATAVVMQSVSAPMPATFTVDRPFLFWIEHTTTGEPLFLGQVTDPGTVGG